MQLAKVNFVKAKKGRILRDQIRTDEIRTESSDETRPELNIFSMNNRIQQNTLKIRQHVERMNQDRLVIQVIKRKPRGRRNV